MTRHQRESHTKGEREEDIVNCPQSAFCAPFKMIEVYRKERVMYGNSALQNQHHLVKVKHGERLHHREVRNTQSESTLPCHDGRAREL